MGKVANFYRSLAMAAAFAAPVLGCGGSGGGSGRPNNLPVIEQIPDQRVDEDSTFTYEIKAVDADGDTLSYGVSGVPVSMSVSGNKLSLTPRNDDVGKYAAVVRAYDKAGESKTHFNLEVVNTPDNPKIITSPVTSAANGVPYKYAVVVEDPDTKHGDKISFRLTQKTDQAAVNSGLSIDSGGSVQWASPLIGKYKVEIEVADSNGNMDIQSFNLDVSIALYDLSGKVVDVNGNPVQNASLNLIGIGQTLTDSKGEYSFQALVPGSYSIEIDNKNFYKIKDTILISGKTTQDFQEIPVQQISSSASEYKDSKGNSDFLNMLKHMTGTTGPSSPTTILQRWANSSVKIFFNEDFNSQSAKQRSPGRDFLSFNMTTGKMDTVPNSTNDIIDISRQVMAELNNSMGFILYEESLVPVGVDGMQPHGEGVFCNWPDSLGSPSVTGTATVFQNSSPFVEVNVVNSLSNDRLKSILKRELVHALGLGYDKENPDYLMQNPPPAASIQDFHIDEKEALKTLYALPQGFDMSKLQER